MSKVNNIKKHKIAALSQLLVESLQDVEADSKWALDIMDNCKSLQEKLEPAVDQIYKIKGVSNSVYMQELTNKIDTIMRKNYKEIYE